MTPDQLTKWEKTRRKGRKHYVLVVGVLFWGLLTGSLWAVAMSAMQGWELLPFYIAYGLIGFPIGGVFFGRWMWNVMEAKYRKAMGEKLDA